MLDLSGSESDTARRFGRLSSWFVASQSDDIRLLRIGAVAERAVDLFHALSREMDPVVDVVIDSWRDRARWRGDLLSLSEVREVLGRLRLPLATYGGAEVTLVTGDDQLTLTPELVVVIFARSDRWIGLLDDFDVPERSSMPPAVWSLDRAAMRPVPEFTAALTTAAETLRLTASPLTMLERS